MKTNHMFLRKLMLKMLFQSCSQVLLSLSVVALVGHAASAQVSSQSTAPGVNMSDQSYIPHRVYDARHKRFTDFEAMLLDLSRRDVVFAGEQHDDPSTHRLERAILEGLARRRSDIVVSLEMFERDTQNILDNYLGSRITEEEFLKSSRPWPRYKTDYRPLVELAKARQWPVLAGNIPRKYAARISREGLGVVERLTPTERQFIAAALQCPFDDYYERFAEVMSSHPVTPATGQPGDGQGQESKRDMEARQREMAQRFYFAQCAKDETMAESIARWFEPAPNRPTPLVVHFNGAFHSDYGLGTAERVSRRLRRAKTAIISIVPLKSLDQIDHDQYRKRGDYVLFTLAGS